MVVMSFTPIVEEITNTTLWIEATPVYFATQQSFTLTESAGGGATTGTIAAGAYGKTAFEVVFKAALEAASFNGYTYTVTSDQINYLAIPNVTPTAFGGSWTIQFNGTGFFNLTWP